MRDAFLAGYDSLSRRALRECFTSILLEIILSAANTLSSTSGAITVRRYFVVTIKCTWSFVKL